LQEYIQYIRNMDEHRKYYSERLRSVLAFLRNAGISEQKIAEYAGISRGTLQNAKKGVSVLAADRYLAIIRYAKKIKDDFRF
jgi:transcriptional regulator with XRE-family HTH domain